MDRTSERPKRLTLDRIANKYLALAFIAGNLAMAVSSALAGANKSDPERADTPSAISTSYLDPPVPSDSTINSGPEMAHPLEHVMVIENGVWNPDKAAADRVATDIKNAGYNSARFVVPTDLWQRSIATDKESGCTAMQSLYDHRVEPFMTTQGYGGGVLGFTPRNSIQIDNYVRTLKSYFETFFGPDSCIDRSKVEIPSNVFNVEIINEPNLSTFWRDQWDEKGNWIAPRDYTIVLAAAYSALKAKQKEINQRLEGTGREPVEVNVIGGAVTSGHMVLRFFKQMGIQMDAIGVKKIFDTVSIHPYGTTSADSPLNEHPNHSFIGFADYGALAATLKDSFGYLPPILYSEYGVETSINPKLRPLYADYKGNGVPVVSPEIQARYYRLALGMAACQPNVIGIGFLHLYDEPGLDGWQSGTYYTPNQNGKAIKKASWKPVRKSIQDALAGRLEC